MYFFNLYFWVFFVCVRMCSLNLNVDAFQYVWKMLRYHIFECCLFLIFYSIFILSLLITITSHHRSKLTICCFCRCLLLTLSFFIVGVCVCVCLFIFCYCLVFWLANQFLCTFIFEIFFFYAQDWTEFTQREFVFAFCQSPGNTINWDFLTWRVFGSHKKHSLRLQTCEGVYFSSSFSWGCILQELAL